MSILQFSLTPDELSDLTHVAGALHREAGQCAEAGCWRAALMLIGSALETGIIVTACCFEPELRRQGLWPHREDPTRWTLGEAINVAKSAGWLPSLTSAQRDTDFMASLDGEVGDAVKFVNHVRTMAVHPGAYVREPMRPDFDDVGHMQLTYDLIDGITGAVFEHLSRAVRYGFGRGRL